MRGRWLALGIVTALVGTGGVTAQEPAQDSVREPVQEPARERAPVPPALEDAVRQVAALELEVMEGGRDTTAARELRDALADARADLAILLDRLVVDADDGAAVLATLRDRYPGAAILDRYAADLALRDGRPGEAADRYRRLLAMRPSDATLHYGLARAWEALDRTDAAWTSYRRAFDLQPGSDSTFRALVRLAADASALEAVLRQVRRLRQLTDDAGLLDREVELLHRLGRPAEARRVLQAARDTGSVPAAADAPPRRMVGGAS